MVQPVLFYDVPTRSDASRSPKFTDMSAKQLGAYYTSSQVADRLVEWALRSHDDTVLDPCFGGGVFLRAAAKRLVSLGGDPSRGIHGVEIDAAVHLEVGTKIRQEFGVPAGNLEESDFFELPPGSRLVDAIVGNPPFIRFHRFTGASRARALRCASESGVTFSHLASSWAPFLVHAISMLKPGGRLAMVVPAELTYATYARPLLRHLERRFESVKLLSFRQRLFLDLNEDTYLLLADGHGMVNREFRIADFRRIGDLSIADARTVGGLVNEQIDVEKIAAGTQRLVEHYVDPDARAIYSSLRQLPSVQPLGAVADVGIGYVTGANRFFHLSEEIVDECRVPNRFLRKAVLRGRGISGTRFTDGDWHAASERGDAGYLLAIPPNHEALPNGLLKRLKDGEMSGISKGFKCRNRTPWYSVPHIYVPDALLTYMSGREPKLVANEANAVAPNTLHIVQIRAGQEGKLPALLTGWHTSLARLSIEIEGHAMGGGMLKIEPSEAERVRVPTVDSGNLSETSAEIDCLLRCGRESEARDLADEVVLRRGLGLTKSACQLLASAAGELALRRVSKGMGLD